jgi:hypothetical protein
VCSFPCAFLEDETSRAAVLLVRFWLLECGTEESAMDCLPSGIFGDLGLPLALKGLRMKPTLRNLIVFG